MFSFAFKGRIDIDEWDGRGSRMGLRCWGDLGLVLANGVATCHIFMIIYVYTEL